MAPKRAFFPKSRREPRAQCTARSAVDGALFSMYLSTVQLTRGFRVKRASGGLRRAPAPVQLRGGIRRISAWHGRHMAPASLRIYTGSCFAPLVAPRAGVVSRLGCLSQKIASPLLRALPPRNCGDPTRARSHFIAPWETWHRDLGEHRMCDLWFFLNHP